MAPEGYIMADMTRPAPFPAFPPGHGQERDLYESPESPCALVSPRQLWDKRGASTHGDLFPDSEPVPMVRSRTDTRGPKGLQGSQSFPARQDFGDQGFPPRFTHQPPSRDHQSIEHSLSQGLELCPSPWPLGCEPRNRSPSHHGYQNRDARTLPLCPSPFVGSMPPEEPYIARCRSTTLMRGDGASMKMPQSSGPSPVEHSRGSRSCHPMFKASPNSSECSSPRFDNARDNVHRAAVSRTWTPAAAAAAGSLHLAPVPSVYERQASPLSHHGLGSGAHAEEDFSFTNNNSAFWEATCEKSASGRRLQMSPRVVMPQDEARWEGLPQATPMASMADSLVMAESVPPDEEDCSMFIKTPTLEGYITTVSRSDSPDLGRAPPPMKQSTNPRDGNGDYAPFGHCSNSLVQASPSAPVPSFICDDDDYLPFGHCNTTPVKETCKVPLAPGAFFFAGPVAGMPPLPSSSPAASPQRVPRSPTTGGMPAYSPRCEAPSPVWEAQRSSSPMLATQSAEISMRQSSSDSETKVITKQRTPPRLPSKGPSQSLSSPCDVSPPTWRSESTGFSVSGKTVAYKQKAPTPLAIVSRAPRAMVLEISPKKGSPAARSPLARSPLGPSPSSITKVNAEDDKKEAAKADKAKDGQNALNSGTKPGERAMREKEKAEKKSDGTKEGVRVTPAKGGGKPSKDTTPTEEKVPTTSKPMAGHEQNEASVENKNKDVNSRVRSPEHQVQGRKKESGAAQKAPSKAQVSTSSAPHSHSIKASNPMGDTKTGLPSRSMSEDVKVAGRSILKKQGPTSASKHDLPGPSDPEEASKLDASYSDVGGHKRSSSDASSPLKSCLRSSGSQETSPSPRRVSFSKGIRVHRFAGEKF